MADTKGALSSLAKTKLTPAYGLEEGETDDAVELATQRVMQAYAARQNLGYDPTLMAFGQGMLSSRGNFAEGLGAGFKSAQEVQQQIRQQDIEDAQAQLMLAQAEREQQNTKRAAAMFGEMTGVAPSKKSGSLSVEDAEAGQQGNMLAGATPVTVDMALKFATLFPKEEKKAAMLMDAAKLSQTRFMSTDSGIVDTWANNGKGGYLDLPSRREKPYDFSTVGGTLTMTPSQNDFYQLAASAGLAQEWIDAFKSGRSTKAIEKLAAGEKPSPAPETKTEALKMPAKAAPKVEGPAAAAEPASFARPAAAAPAAVSPAAAPASSGRTEPPGVAQAAVSNFLNRPVRPNGVLSKEQLEDLKRMQDLDAEIAKAQAKANIDFENTDKTKKLEAENARKSLITEKSDVARESIALAQQFRKLSEDPSAAKIMGVFSNNKVFSAIIDLVEGGIGTKDYSIGIPGLGDIVKKLDLNPAEMRTAQTMAMLVAQMQLSNGKLLKGSTSNYETQLMGMAGVTNKDIPEAVRTKADMLERKAMFHRDEERLLSKYRGSLSDFYNSMAYEDMYKKYLIELTGIAAGELKLNSSYGKPPAAPTGKRDNAAAAKKLG
jgi:hypothetical protein